MRQDGMQPAANPVHGIRRAEFSFSMRSVQCAGSQPERDSPGGLPDSLKGLRRPPESTIWLPELYLVVIKLLSRHNSAVIGVHTQ